MSKADPFREQINVRLNRRLIGSAKRLSEILGIHLYEAVEQALSDWVGKHQNEAQMKLDVYAREKGITIIEPQAVNIAVFQKAEVMVAKEELQRLLGVLESVKDPEYKRETQLELTKALRMFRPVCTQTRDPELLELLAQIEKRLG